MATIEELVNNLDIPEGNTAHLNLYLYDIMKEARVMSKNWNYVREYLTSYLEKVHGFPFEDTPQLRCFLSGMARGFSDGYNLSIVYRIRK